MPTLLSILLLWGSAWAAEPGFAGALAGRHRTLACDDCHPGGLADAVPCLDCHRPEDNLHPDQVLPTGLLPDSYPLQEGVVSCPTCHRLHQPTGPHFLRGFAEGLAADLKEFCVSCHGERLVDTNPHQASAGEHRCAFCHSSLDAEAVLAGGAVGTRARAERLCDFCHDVRSRNHPRNIDPVLELPGTLPRGPGGEVTCTTCHDPHGSSVYTHYIREGYAHHFERGRQENPHRNDRFACGACHVEPRPESLGAGHHALRFQGDAILLCVSCHVTARSHHPAGIPLSNAMAGRLGLRGGLPLDTSGRITCVTCHTNNCATGEQRMSVRHYDARHMRLDLCWRCHPKEEFAATDPHSKSIDGAADGCVFCHDRPPVKGLETASDLYFVSQVKMICLRCHEDLSDQDVSHMGKVPSEAVKARLLDYAAAHDTEFPLDRDGHFTCTTCHNAHFSAKNSKHKTRLPSDQMCDLCHRR